MLRLLLILMLPFSAYAKPLDWRDADCGDLPFSVQGEFECKTGESIPANDMKFFHATRDMEDEFLRYYFITLKGMRHFVPLSGRDLIEDFKAIDSWAQNAKWSSVKSDKGRYALATVGKWSCIYHRSLHGHKQQGYRHALYLTYCRPNSVSDNRIGDLLGQISWD